MQAIINNVSYQVLGHYAEQGGMARLILQGENISFDELKANIEEAEEILITNETDQVVATYVGYTKIRQFSVTLTEDNQSQIELTLEAENVVVSIENAQKKIMNNTQVIETLSNSIETLTSNNETQSGKIDNLEESLENLTQDFTMFQQEIREQLASIQESIENAQTELDRIDATVM